MGRLALQRVGDARPRLRVLRRGPVELGPRDGGGDVLVVYGLRTPEGRVKRRPSPQEWAWLAYLGEQLGRLPDEWDEIVRPD